MRSRNLIKNFYLMRSDQISPMWNCLVLWYDLIGSHQIEILDQISWSHFWLLFLDQISWSIFPITLWSAWFEFPSNLVELPVRSDLWSQLTWSFDLIWSDRMWSDPNYWSNFLIAFLVQVCWSNFLIHLSDHDIFSYRSLQISRSTLLIIIFDQFPFCSDRFSPRLNFLFKFVDAPFRSCAFFFWPLVRSPSMDIDGSWLV